MTEMDPVSETYPSQWAPCKTAACFDTLKLRVLSTEGIYVFRMILTPHSVISSNIMKRVVYETAPVPSD
jgi:hypothetical protein